VEKTQLYYWLAAEASPAAVYFRDRHEVDAALPELLAEDIAIFEVDAGGVHTIEDLYRLFAAALQMPPGWYGKEEYAPNADAFLEYLDDVATWVPAKHHVVLVREAESLWRRHPQFAGTLTELLQFAESRAATVRLVFVW
jgi:hypothetical protein